MNRTHRRLENSGPTLTLGQDSLWSDPVLATSVAVVAVSLLVVTAWMVRRHRHRGRGAATICLVTSVGLHLLLVVFLPRLRGSSTSADGQSSDRCGGDSPMVMATFDPEMSIAEQAASDDTNWLDPLPLPTRPAGHRQGPSAATDPPPDSTPENPEPPAISEPLPESLGTSDDDDASTVDDLLAQWLSDEPDASRDRTDSAADHAALSSTTPPASPEPDSARTADDPPGASPSESGQATPATVPAELPHDFASRFGDAKRLALQRSGGDESTEAAVAAALHYLAADQRPDGSWDPLSSGAGHETRTLGTDRQGAGRTATTGITGLALLSMLGAGNTHQQGPYAENVHRGLSYLILNQKSDGSLAGGAGLYEANYCHAMAALAMCEAALLTRDPAAITAATAATRYTRSMQNQSTGGWRYVRGDAGDLSQLGWHLMVLDAGQMAGIQDNDAALRLAGHFLRSVRAGTHGGLASYRPGESPSRPMTAEALASRLMLRQEIPEAELREAQTYLLRQPPGVGRDNYYGWYYTALALHQLHDDAWRRWNAEMKRHLLARQRPDGSWPQESQWGGYGGRVYTTAMAALCLEVYYRHGLRQRHMTR